MTSERQITANRHNARKSTGPKSHNGKRRSAGNARKHGLAESITAQTEYARLIDALAYKIAGETPSAIKRAYARVIAGCEVELHRVRCVRVGLIERARVAEWVHTGQEEGALGKRSHRKGSAAPATGEEEPLRDIDHNAEAIRRVLPDLAKISRYERRAVAKRDRAVRCLLKLPPAL